MSPIEQIKQGIITSNWSIVCSGYKSMTGEEITPPELSNETDILRQIIQIASSVFDEDVPAGKCDESCNTEKVYSHLITEEPDPEEVEANKKKAARTNKQRRSPPKTYMVKCSECDKDFATKISSGDIGQKCKTCLAKLKRHR